MNSVSVVHFKLKNTYLVSLIVIVIVNKLLVNMDDSRAVLLGSAKGAFLW
jgi:hypothetical protein